MDLRIKPRKGGPCVGVPRGLGEEVVVMSDLRVW